MQAVLCSAIMLLSPPGSIEANSTPAFDMDDQGMLAKVLQHAVKGRWNEFRNKSLPFDEFRQRNGRQYLRSEEEPFSGWSGQWDDNETLRNLRHFSGGIPWGPIYGWRANGMRSHQGNYEKGRKHGTFYFWNENLTKTRETNYKNGKLDGNSTTWYASGRESCRLSFKSGKIISAIGWKPDGQRCPSTRVTDGVGVVLLYTDEETGSKPATPAKVQQFVIERYDNGNKREEGTYLDGKKEGLWIYYRTDGTEFFRETYQSGFRQRLIQSIEP